MRTLKHWTVSVQPVRKGREGYLSYYQYLTSNSGKHKNNIINEISSKKNAFITIRNGDAFNLANQLKKKAEDHQTMDTAQCSLMSGNLTQKL